MSASPPPGDLADRTRRYEALYAGAWADLARLRADPRLAPWLLPEATPVLAYGAWQTARLTTAALNPSEDEFQTRDAPRRPLPAAHQRLLHWPADGHLTPARLAEARRRAEGYFTLGQAYATWFGRYRGLLAGLDLPFERGLACQTNYGSPFTTVVGWGAVRPAAVRTRLAADGAPRWRHLLDLLPCLEIILGQGRAGAASRRSSASPRTRGCPCPPRSTRKGARPPGRAPICSITP
ncbi:MAG TPA: hypothetical protein VKY74_13260 [Chloroflexia bacterium]|nr:hypothetical protein [Chloroflexia bacterium]